MLPQRSMAIADIGEDLEPYWWASTPDGITIALEPGETEILRSNCRVTIISRPRVVLPVTTSLLVTDRRIAWATTKFDKGGGYSSLSAPALSLGMNAVSKMRAKNRSRGKVAIGQTRYEWLEGLVLRQKKSLIGVVDYYVDLMLPCTQGKETIELWSKSTRGSRTVDAEFAKNLAIQVLQRRMSLDPNGVGEYDEQLNRVRSGISDESKTLKPGDIGWAFPGKTQGLIDAAMQS
jgi:hypothetical protein